MPFKPNEREYRAFTNFSLDTEAEKDNKIILRGTPIVFETPTVICEIDGVQYKEVISRNALTGCDMSDFIFNRNHGRNDSTVFARSKNGTVKPTITASGLDCEFVLNGEDERHKNLQRDIKNGLIDKMSFSFVVLEETYNRETHTRRIEKVKKLFDVSAVDFAAYETTSITSARDFFSAEHEKEFRKLEQQRRRQKLIIQTLL